MASKSKKSVPYEALKIRGETKRQVERIALENRLQLSDAAEVLVEAWDKLSAEQQTEIIRRPATVTA